MAEAMASEKCCGGTAERATCPYHKPFAWARRVVPVNERIQAKERAQWSEGPWKDEPDIVEWRHEGFACLLVRNACGALCGYVGVPPGHPYHGKDYGEVESQSDLRCHGGLTYSNSCGGAICHEPSEGEPDDVWWLGFDCAHAYDLVPGLARYGRLSETDAYCTLDYVRGEVEELARQLKAVTA